MKQRIVNAKIVNEGLIIEGDLLIENERILGINLPSSGGEKIVDADGGYLIPGMIDDQVHFREPGLEHKGEIATESRAAVAGGITSYMEMPNCNPLTISEEKLIDKRNRASQKSLANYAFYLGATNDNLENIKRVNHHLTCGIKIFMGASTGDMLVDNPQTLEGIFASTDLLVATHCEDTPTILKAEQAAKKRWGNNTPFDEHPNIRSEEACYKSSSLAVSLAKKHGTKLHVLHLTTEKELSLFQKGPVQGKQITAEACVHHLFFSEEDYQEKGSLIKCNPAIKKKSDRESLRKAVDEDLIDVIATDHAPHTKEEKSRQYFDAPAGLPLVQHALISLFDRYSDNTFTVEKIVQKTSHAPAQLFRITERGFIREGYFADLTIVKAADPSKTPEILSKCGWSPFQGHSFSHEITHTWINGNLAYENNQVDRSVRGRALVFNRD
jgi:dihydroorotase